MRIATKLYRSEIIILLILLSTVIGFLYLNPTSRSLLFPNLNKSETQDWLTKLEKNKNIDVQEFWKKREFSGIYQIEFDKSGVNKEKINTFLSENNLTFTPQTFILPFLLFKSNRWNSIEMLSSNDNLSLLLKYDPTDFNKIKTDKILLRVDANQNKALLIFIASIDEMKKANGYFDYQQWDKNLVKNRYWLIISSINF